MTTADDPRTPTGRILVLADRSAEGRSARRWAARHAGALSADILVLPARDDLHPTIPAQRTDVLVLGVHAEERETLPTAMIELIETAPCPTLLFRSATGEPGCVTAAVTGEHTDTDVIGRAVRLAGLTHSPLHLVHRADPEADEDDEDDHVLSTAERLVRNLAPDLIVSTGI